MRVVGYEHDGRRHVGALVDGDHLVLPLGPVEDFYADLGAARARVAAGGALLDRASLVEVPFVPETARVFCVGVNYRDHAEESAPLTGFDAPPVPLVFGRWASTLVVDGAEVPVPPREPGLDWEAELAVVIGARVWLAEAATALSHVAGYTAFNDLSARTKQLQTSQFTLGKNADRSGPIGPVLVTADELDPADLEVTCRVNGEVMQHARTRDLVHGIGAIIEYLSDTVTLLPGDVIATGTPGGVGFARTPPVFLTPGDAVEVEIEGIGVLRTPIVAR